MTISEKKTGREGRDGKLDLSECTLFKSFDFIQPLSLTLCDPMDCSMPGFPVLYYLPEFAQTHVHWVSDTIQPSHPLSPSSLVLNLSQHQGLFQWVGSSHQVASASVLSMNIQGWFPLGLTGLISLLFKGLSRVFSNTTMQKHQFFSAQPSLWSSSHIHTWLLGKTMDLTRWTFVSKVMSLLFSTLSLS